MLKRMACRRGEVMITIAEPIDLDSLRIRHEFLVVPDLHLSAATAAAALQVSQRHAIVVLEALVVERFLIRLADGRYARPPAAPH